MGSCREKTVSALLAGILFLLISRWLRELVSPLLTGICLAIFLDPLRGFFEKRLPGRPRRMRRYFAVFLSLSAVAAALFLLLRYAGPKLAESIGQAAELLPGLTRQADEMSRMIAARTHIDLSSLPGAAVERLFSMLGEAADRLFSGSGSLFVGLVLAVWILAGRDSIFAFAERLCGLSPAPEARREDLALCRRCFAAFVRGQLTESAILSAGCFAGMLLFQKPFAGLISLTVGLTALLPAAGAWIGAAFGAVLLFSKSFADGLWFLVFIVLLQQLENNLIYPRVMGRTVGLPGGLVLPAVLTGGALFGIPGMLLFVPAASFLWQKMDRTLP